VRSAAVVIDGFEKINNIDDYRLKAALIAGENHEVSVAAFFAFYTGKARRSTQSRYRINLLKIRTPEDILT